MRQITPDNEIETRLMRGRNSGGANDAALDAVGEDVNIDDRPKEKPIV